MKALLRVAGQAPDHAHIHTHRWTWRNCTLQNRIRTAQPRVLTTHAADDLENTDEPEGIMEDAKSKDKPAALVCYDFIDWHPFFTKYPLDKAADSRQNRNLMFEQLKSPQTKVIFFHEGKCLFQATKMRTETDAMPRDELTSEKQMPKSQPVMLQPFGNYKDLVQLKVGTVFLGFEKDEPGCPVVSAIIRPDMSMTLCEEGEDWAWKSVLKEAPKMSEKNAALMAFVTGMMEFHLKNVKCGRTGQSTGPVSGGHGRVHKSREGLAKVPKELRPHVIFPRIDPAVLVLVHSGDYCLLGRKQGWTQSKYSLLAGFAEVGESLEQTCVREVMEESNVQVDVKTLQYMGSQPWPFPQSLMVGYHGSVESPSRLGMVQSFPQTLSGNLTGKGKGLDRLSSQARFAALETNLSGDEVDRYLGICLPPTRPQPQEVADARWYHVDFLLDAMKNKTSIISFPGVYAMSRRMLNTWLDSRVSNRSSWGGDNVPDVKIEKGKFKYVLMRISDTHGNSKVVVRGTTAAQYHMNIKGAMDNACTGQGLRVDALGGGRIEHEPDKGMITIYGYSSAFGPAVHEVAGALCQRWYPQYDSRMIKVSYDGY